MSMTRTAPKTQIKKIGPGFYETQQGHLIEWHRAQKGAAAGWAITYPGEASADVSRPTLREARAYIEAEAVDNRIYDPTEAWGAAVSEYSSRCTSPTPEGGYNLMTETEPETQIKTTWTLAYRHPRANHFKRVANWAGTWAQALYLAQAFGKLHPDMQIYYTATAASEREQLDWMTRRVAAGMMTQDLADSYFADHGSILLEGFGHRDRKTGEWVGGRRVKIRETGTLAPHELTLVLSAEDAKARFERKAA